MSVAVTQYRCAAVVVAGSGIAAHYRPVLRPARPRITDTAALTRYCCRPILVLPACVARAAAITADNPAAAAIPVGAAPAWPGLLCRLPPAHLQRPAVPQRFAAVPGFAPTGVATAAPAAMFRDAAHFADCPPAAVVAGFPASPAVRQITAQCLAAAPVKSPAVVSACGIVQTPAPITGRKSQCRSALPTVQPVHWRWHLKRQQNCPATTTSSG